MEINLIIKSEKLEKIKQELLNTANEIKDAINNKQPIWIRHHNDCDGYSGAVILEKAILTHLHKFHKRESDIFYYFKRFPLRTPYYDYFDVTKDISTFLADYERFQRKKPLIIIIDTGSNTESLLALKKLAVYNIDVIVIDHHPINDENIKYIKKHINSTTINDGSITAGMLSCEISKLLEPNIKNPELFAALSGIGDKSENFEQEEYLKKTLNLGFTKEYLSELKDMINFESDYLLFNESKSYIHDILFNSIDNQKKIIEITKEENNKINEKLLFTIKKYIEEINCNISENKNNSEIFNNHSINEDSINNNNNNNNNNNSNNNKFILGLINVEKYFHKNYKSYSKISSLSLNYLDKKTNKNIVMIAYGDDIITFRISKKLSFDVNKIKKALIQKFPYAFIEGGGHAKAGTITFNKNSKNDIIEFLKRYFKGELNDRL